MTAKKSKWSFYTNLNGRYTKLTRQEAAYWQRQFTQNIKAGIELEYNLPTNRNATCHGISPGCSCTAQFKAKNPMRGTQDCFEQCSSYRGGACEILKEHGCAGLQCYAFTSPCPSCNKFDTGCDDCRHYKNPEKVPLVIRKKLIEELKPSNFVGDVGKSGVLKVLTDGSLSGDKGVEVVTVGRRLQYSSIMEMLTNIINKCQSKGAFVNERCSIHVHFLMSYLTPSFDDTSYYIKKEITELEKPMPDIILANFHQLYRKYENALIWMSSTGQGPDSITRWLRFRKSLAKFSPVRHSMKKVVHTITNPNRRYYGINYKNMEFNSDSDISRFHIESRFMDGSFSPTQITSLVFLVFGMLAKAIELSRWGLISIGTREEIKKRRDVHLQLCNDISTDWGNSRKSNNARLDVYIPTLIEEAKDLVRLIRNTIKDDGNVVEVLTKLCTTPVSTMINQGMSWKHIEASLVGEDKVSSEVVDTLEQLVSTAMICDCTDEEEWVRMATDHIIDADTTLANTRDVVYTNVASLVEDMKKKASLWWEPSVGSYIAK